MRQASFGLAISLVHFLCTASEAQLVQVGPGYVKAPFVRVYTHPDGSSYVRAPFVKVFSPGYSDVEWISASRVPTVEDFAEMDWSELRESIRNLVLNLDAELDQFGTGDLWKVELKTAEVRALAHGSGPPTDSDAAKLEAILVRYDAAKGNSKARAVWEANSFQTLYAALDEYLTPPAARFGRQLRSASSDLYRALDEFPTGAGWQKYLALPGGTSRSQTHDAKAAQAEPAMTELESSLGRYESVSRDDRYRTIARLPEFKEAHDRLVDYVGYLQNPQPVSDQSAEELPAPAPSPRPR